MTETFAVALLAETDTGWLVDAAAAEGALEIVHGTVPRAQEMCRRELFAWTNDAYRIQYLLRAPFPSSWTRL